MKYSELERKLKAAGCSFFRKGGRHPIWYSPITGQYFELSYHPSQEVKTGTLKSISKSSGVKI
ncbi:MAG: type II toxin-antitoxin system HicA family toxin [Prevotella sp.]|jgi:predicted RNA binding protein YcfA (HicA-like mRNA interferase family)|nr:type II toxin-antitoxin system HicA family toxin [Prevotella sp.]